METVNAEVTAGLRELADWLDAHPDEQIAAQSIRLLAYRMTREEFQATVRALGRGVKSQDDQYAAVIRSFGPAVEIYAYTSREQVCRKVVKGTRVVPAQVIPERVEEIVEWICSEPILAAAAKGDVT